MTRRLTLIVALVVGLTVPAWAGFDEGMAAYERGDYETALREWRPLAEHGITEAQFHLSVMYLKGEGVPKDDVQSNMWLNRAVSGLPPEYRDSAYIFRDIAERELANRRAAHSWAEFHRGGEAYNRKDYGTALRVWRPLAEQGDAIVQFAIGVMYDNGLGTTQDHGEAIRWYREAAKQGHIEAQFYVGAAYNNGRGVSQDYAEAAKWYRRAAQLGNAKAQVSLGFMYHAGRNFSQNYAEAVRWYREAAVQEYARAQFFLGIMYFKGWGVARDFVQSHMWLSLAAAQRTKMAREYRDQVSTFMTPEQIAKAQRLAREWKPLQ